MICIRLFATISNAICVLFISKGYKCTATQNAGLLLLQCLLGSLSLLALSNLCGGGLDNTNSNGLPHVTNSKPSKRRILGESFYTHRFAWNKLDNGSITRLDELGIILGGLT